MIPRLPAGFTHPMCIGEGAFSSVYRVRQTTLDRWVAIKIILEKDSERRKELLKEAKTQANIHLECVPQVYDAFEWKKRVCIVMQWLKGISLQQVLDQNPSINHRYRIADALIRAVTSLHEQGFAHRDLKPDNVLISPEYGIFLVDFGFTKDVINGKQSMTGMIKGTPAYMAPEIWNSGEAVDPLRSDLYSLGKILKELFPDENSLMPLINLLLEESPEKRPESAALFYKQWKQLNGVISGLSTWKQIAGTMSSFELSRKLLIASKELLFAHNYDEAYWLLVESLEEDPEYEDALEFMHSFPNSKADKSRYNLILVSVALIILCILLGVAYFAGRIAQKHQYLLTLDERNNANSSKLFVTSVSNSNLENTSTFLTDTSEVMSMGGKIVLKKHPKLGTLKIDTVQYTNDTLFRTGIICTYGPHLLQWVDTADNILWKEKINLLPFQVKRISVKTAESF